MPQKQGFSWGKSEHFQRKNPTSDAHRPCASSRKLTYIILTTLENTLPPLGGGEGYQKGLTYYKQKSWLLRTLSHVSQLTETNYSINREKLYPST